jgi:hypothetical protein
MQWSEVTARPSPKTLRQFAGLFLIVFGALAGLRAWRGDTGTITTLLGGAAAIIGILGLIAPEAIRWVYTVWMIAAFPIGWTISKIIVTALSIWYSRRSRWCSPERRDAWSKRPQPGVCGGRPTGGTC